MHYADWQQGELMRVIWLYLHFALPLGHVPLAESITIEVFAYRAACQDHRQKRIERARERGDTAYLSHTIGRCAAAFVRS